MHYTNFELNTYIQANTLKKYFSKIKNSVIIQTLLVNCNLLKTMSLEQKKVTV